MRFSRLPLGLALASAVTASAAFAQEMRQPASTVAFNEYYQPMGEKSPSDKPAPAPMMAEAPASMNVDCGCNTGCNSCNSCDSCGGGCGCKLNCPDACPMWHLFDDCCCLKEHCATLGGYLEGGYTANGRGRNDAWNGPVGFNDRADEFEGNQAYISLEKVTKSCDCDWDLGGRIDFLYGTDARWIESAGLEKNTTGNEKWVKNSRLYHLAMVQAYAEVAKEDWKVKIGKFITSLEYETIDRRNNFFYSNSYGFLYGVNFTETGVMATKTVDENFNWQVGFSTGVDNFVDNDGRIAFLGGFNWTSCDKKTNIAYNIIVGDERNIFGNETNQTNYSLVWTEKLNDRLTNVFVHDLGVQAKGACGCRKDATWYSLADYLLYQLSCDWWLGGRVEWFRDTDGTRVAPPGDSLNANAASFPGSNAASSGGFAGDFYEYTIGLNYKPLSNPNLVVRPELRYDNYSGTGHPFDNGTKNNQFLFAIDAIYQF